MCSIYRLTLIVKQSPVDGITSAPVPPNCTARPVVYWTLIHEARVVDRIRAGVHQTRKSPRKRTVGGTHNYSVAGEGHNN